MLQPMEGGVANRTKHKFMVQTMMAPPEFLLENLDAVVSVYVFAWWLVCMCVCMVVSVYVCVHGG